MTDNSRNPVLSIRVGQLTRSQLDTLCKKWGMSLAQVVTTLTDRAYQQETQTMTYETTLQCTAGSRTNPVHANVQFSGKLSPAVAIDTARRAFGHAHGVTVTDPQDGTTYRCTNGKARKVKQDPELWTEE